MASKQRKVASDITETFPPDTVQQWKRMVREWEMDSSCPNPYVSKDRGRLLRPVSSTMAHTCFLSFKGIRNSATTRSGGGHRGRKRSTTAPPSFSVGLHSERARS